MNRMSLLQFYSLLDKNEDVVLTDDIYIRDSLRLIERLLLFIGVISLEKPAKFNTEFNGDGHTIYNLSNQFCKSVCKEGVIKNVSIESENTFEQSVICTENKGSIQNVNLNVIIESDTGKLGSIAESNTGVIQGCSFTGELQHKSYDTGGIVSVNENKITDCTVCSTITGDCETGGIVSTNKNGTIEGCTVIGKTIIRGRTNTAGIAALNTGTVSKCKISNADIMTETDRTDIYAFGGIVAVNNGLVESCTCGDGVEIRGGEIVGGLVGENVNTVHNSTVKSAVEVSGTEIVGGVIGDNSESSIVRNVIVQNCYVHGDKYIGGITGMSSSVHKQVISDSKVAGCRKYGSLFGYLRSGSKSSNCYTSCDSDVSLVGSKSDSVSIDTLYEKPDSDLDTLRALCLT